MIERTRSPTGLGEPCVPLRCQDWGHGGLARFAGRTLYDCGMGEWLNGIAKLSNPSPESRRCDKLTLHMVNLPRRSALRSPI